MEQPKNNLKVVSNKKNARVILPNMLTLIGVCIGLTSIRFALDEKFGLAIIAIIFAALIDGLDGRIARLIKGTSKVGKELDSLTDMISFGVAPAFIMYFWKLNSLGRFGWLLCLIYVICVALRLARFNVNSSEEPSWKDNFFEGVPSPAGGILVLTPLIFSLSGLDVLRSGAQEQESLQRIADAGGVANLAKGGRAGFASGTGGYDKPSHRQYLQQMDADLLKHFKRYKKIYGGKMKMKQFAPKFIKEYADCGIAGLSGGDKSGPPPESGPNSQGLPGLLKRVKKL